MWATSIQVQFVHTISLYMSDLLSCLSIYFNIGVSYIEKVSSLLPWFSVDEPFVTGFFYKIRPLIFYLLDGYQLNNWKLC